MTKSVTMEVAVGSSAVMTLETAVVKIGFRSVKSLLLKLENHANSLVNMILILVDEIKAACSRA